MSENATARSPIEALTETLGRERDKLAACVHCGFCLPVCPTYTRLGDEADSPRGRLYLMRAAVEGRIAGDSSAFGAHIDRCLGCRACETVCPSGVEYGSLLEQARAAIARETGGSLPERLLLAIFGSWIATRLALAGGRVLRGTRLLPMLIRRLPGRLGRLRFGLAMLAATAPPRLAGADALRHGPTSIQRAARRGPTVALLTGCVQAGLFGRVNDATERVLRANGCRVVRVRDQRCCGALHAHGGALDRARELARANIDAFERAGVDRIIVNAAGCGSTMKEYGELLAHDADDAERAHGFAARVCDLSELLDELGPLPGAPLPLRATYDAPCHLHHAQRITESPMAVLESIPGLELVPLPRADECCGGAGIYGLLHPELGGRILDDKVEAIRSTHAEIVATPNPGCMMQIGAGLLLAGESTAVLHPVELLDRSYALAGLYGGTDRPRVDSAEDTDR